MNDLLPSYKQQNMNIEKCYHCNLKLTNLKFCHCLFSIVLSPHLAQDCSADDDNFLVPIAVGAALAGVLILVLLAYFIGLKRHRAGYEQF